MYLRGQGYVERLYNNMDNVGGLVVRGYTEQVKN